ncbi:hypothetical protein ES695_14965 [Candidatus Atribacteria bacterium 1244-E10-H5-B2]|nr:MAG: hypothetical protein ES695_14965 [Candidatus Atribacteria bacterium 1244-E10-H5-B2]
MKRIKVRCARCGKNLFFLLPKDPAKGGPIIEIKCYKDRCEAINIVDYQDPDSLVVRLKE